MCGIAGWFDIDAERDPPRDLVQAMCNAIRHRGPDGEGFFFAPGVGFGHRRLAVIDLATGDQPMFSEDRSVCIVFNGEIYNFRELRQSLKSRGHAFHSESDTEVIIRAWQEWGRDCVNHLTGMFAFALWDRVARTLFLARDRLGEKPLYYSVLRDNSILFGSEIKALLEHPALIREVDAAAVEEFFALGYIAEPRTIYSAVKQLPAGHTLTIQRAGSLKLETYWDVQPEQKEIGVSSFEDDLIARLSKIVESQLVADVPVGAFLSGGVDSGGITALMAEVAKDPIMAFTIGFDTAHSDYDETPYARSIADRYGARHIVGTMTGNEGDLVEKLPVIFDQPFGDSSALPTYLLMQLARKSVTVALSGDGGDELFAGYRRYAFHCREEIMRKVLPISLRGPLFGILANVYPQMDWAPRFLRARHTLRELSLDTAMGYFANVSVADDEMRADLFSPKLRKALEGYHASDVLSRHMQAAPSEDPLAIAQYTDIKTWLPSDILTKVDRTAMACSLEVRVPMLDHTFVNWAIGLPTAAKLKGGAGKVALKKAFERLVPLDTLYRPKRGFSVPLASWFRGFLGEHFAASIASRALACADYLRQDTIQRLLDQHRRGSHDHSRVLWLVWMFEAFMRNERRDGASGSRGFMASSDSTVRLAS